MTLMRFRLAFVLATTFVTAAHAEQRVWNCSVEPSGATSLVLVAEDNQGHLVFSNQKIESNYSLIGLERRWTWESDDNRQLYSVVLGLDNKAKYSVTQIRDGGSSSSASNSPNAVQMINCVSTNTSSPKKNSVTNTVEDKSTATAHWQQLRFEMSKDEVRYLLGEPKSVSELSSSETWHYSSSSYVVFKKPASKRIKRGGVMRSRNSNGEDLTLQSWQFSGGN